MVTAELVSCCSLVERARACQVCVPDATPEFPEDPDPASWRGAGGDAVRKAVARKGELQRGPGRAVLQLLHRRATAVAGTSSGGESELGCDAVFSDVTPGEWSSPGVVSTSKGVRKEYIAAAELWHEAYVHLKAVLGATSEPRRVAPRSRPHWNALCARTRVVGTHRVTRRGPTTRALSLDYPTVYTVVLPLLPDSPTLPLPTQDADQPRVGRAVPRCRDGGLHVALEFEGPSL